MKKFVLCLIFLLPLSSNAKVLPDSISTYKTINNIELKLHIFNPPNHKPTDSTPAIVFFFGGGWTHGTALQFYKQSEYLSSRGMVAISAEYRIESLHGTSPKEAVMDGKSAIRWIRKNAKHLGINPSMLAAGGGSAGGHVATAAATLSNFNEQGEDISISAIPNALVLFNPVIDNGVGGYGYDRVATYWQDFSPMHNLHKDVPPTIVFFGTKDKFVPVTTIKKFITAMNALGIPNELHLYKDQSHGFFNVNRYLETMLETDKFLSNKGFLQCL